MDTYIIIYWLYLFWLHICSNIILMFTLSFTIITKLTFISWILQIVVNAEHVPLEFAIMSDRRFTLAWKWILEHLFSTPNIIFSLARFSSSYSVKTFEFLVFGSTNNNYCPNCKLFLEMVLPDAANQEYFQLGVSLLAMLLFAR